MFSQVFKDTPESVSGYEQLAYEIKLVKPKTATNLISNPSLETNTTGWSSQGAASIARISTQQRRGVYSLQVTPTSAVSDGCGYGISLTSGTLYFVSVDVLGAAGVQYLLRVGSLSTHPGTVFYGTGKWQRINTTIVPNATATWTVTVLKNGGASTAVFYVDGLQVETGALTTYLDGSMKGFVKGQLAYYWDGTEHGSTSTRIFSTRSGGQEYNLADFGFTVTALIGLGWSEFENVAQDNAFLGGASYQNSIQKAKKFDIVGFFSADSLPDLMRKKSDLRAILDYRAGIVHQPLQLKIRIKNSDGVYISEPMIILCLFDEGMGGVRDNYFQERTSLSFRVFKPYLGELDGYVGTALGYSESLLSLNHVARRVNEQWLNMGTGLNNEALVIAIDHGRGRVYLGGTFTTANGGTVNRVCYWDLATGTYVAMDGGVNGTVNSLAIAPNGDVWVGGSFNLVGSGAAATIGLARWNVTAGTWTAFNVSIGVFSFIGAIAIGPDGTVVIAGSFTDWAGVLAADYIAQYDGASWTAIGTTPFTSALFPSHYQALAFDSAGVLWAGESVDSGSAAARLHRWDGSAWTVIASTASSATASINALFFDDDGRLYLGGAFATIDGVTVNSIAVYNGTSFSALGDGANGSPIRAFAKIGNLLVVVGSFVSLGHVEEPIAFWSGSIWVGVDFSPGSIPIYAVAAHGNDLYLGFDSSSGANVSDVTTVENPGSTDVFPRFIFTGPGILILLKNPTTGSVLLFNLTLLTGETAVLELSPGNVSFGSNFRPNLLGTIIPGPNVSGFRLAAGDNTLMAYIKIPTTAATSITMQFAPTYVSLDDILYR